MGIEGIVERAKSPSESPSLAAALRRAASEALHVYDNGESRDDISVSKMSTIIQTDCDELYRAEEEEDNDYFNDRDEESEEREQGDENKENEEPSSSTPESEATSEDWSVYTPMYIGDSQFQSITRVQTNRALSGLSGQTDGPLTSFFSSSSEEQPQAGKVLPPGNATPCCDQLDTGTSSSDASQSSDSPRSGSSSQFGSQSQSGSSGHSPSAPETVVPPTEFEPPSEDPYIREYRPVPPDFAEGIRQYSWCQAERDRSRLRSYGSDAEEVSQYLRRFTPSPLRERRRQRLRAWLEIVEEADRRRVQQQRQQQGEEWKEEEEEERSPENSQQSRESVQKGIEEELAKQDPLSPSTSAVSFRHRPIESIGEKYIGYQHTATKEASTIDNSVLIPSSAARSKNGEDDEAEVKEEEEDDEMEIKQESLSSDGGNNLREWPEVRYSTGSQLFLESLPSEWPGSRSATQVEEPETGTDQTQPEDGHVNDEEHVEQASPVPIRNSCTKRPLDEEESTDRDQDTVSLPPKRARTSGKIVRKLKNEDQN